MAQNVLDLLQYGWVQNMFWAALLAGLACGLIGTYVVVRRVVFISGGIAHTTFGGVGFAYWLQSEFLLGWFDPILGALTFALGSAIIISSPFVRERMREDSTIGVLWVVGMALGVLFLNYVDRSKVLVQDTSSILFGNILFISDDELLVMLMMVIGILAVVMVLYKDLQILTFDEEFAQVSGINVGLMTLILFGLIAVTTVMLVKVVGVVLVIALLTIPASIAGLYTKDLRGMMMMGTVIAVLLTSAGLVISLAYDTPSGATIVMVLGAAFLVAMTASALRRKATVRSS